MKVIKTSLLVFTCVSLLAPFLLADSITLPGTGFSSTGAPLSSGSIDGNWFYNTNGNAYFIAPGNPDWWSMYAANTNVATFSGSGWISNNAESNYNGPATYTFWTSFDLAGFNLSTMSMSGYWAVTDAGTLTLNGHLVDTYSNGNGTALQAFNVMDPSWFLQANNILTITVTQSDLYYEAARLEGTATGTRESPVVPEPSSLLLLGSGLVTYVTVEMKRRGYLLARH